MIEILCDARSHTPATIDRFERLRAGEWFEHMFTRRGGVTVARPSSAAQLVADAVDEPPFNDPQPDTHKTRRRYGLRCGLCADHVTVKQENLFPILDGLEAAGIGSITLNGLRHVLT